MAQTAVSRSRNIRRACSIAFFILLFLGCGRVSGNAIERSAGSTLSKAAGPQQVSPEAQATLNAYIGAAQLPDLNYPDFQSYRVEIEEFYRSFGNTLPWVRDRRPSPQAQALLSLFKRAEDEGLNPVDYDGARWDARLRTIESGRSSDSELVRFDLAITISTMRYVSDLHHGRVNTRKFYFDLDIESRHTDLSEFLRQKLDSADDVSAMMKNVEPPFPAYRPTVEALKAYMRLASEAGNEPLPLPTKSVRLGDSYSGVARLDQLLRLIGDMPKTAEAIAPDLIYRAPLAAAVKRFQRRHGLEPNGILESRTFKELNVPLSWRALQIKLTLERWRWLPHKFNQPPIIVNIPGFLLYAVNEENRPEFSMKVVVGRSYKNQTPVFATEMKSVIFRPYWNVPLSIQRKELVPALRKNPTYLREHSYEVVTADGAIVGDDAAREETERELYSGKLAIRQRPGPDNSLGLVKFDMPNIYDVYMHDTPATQLFSRSRRDFSHGCIRVEDPIALAAWVLREKPGWDTARIRAAMNGNQTFRVSLTKPIPVFILYGTAIVTEQGEVNFFDDIYGLDTELAQVLAKGYPYSRNE